MTESWNVVPYRYENEVKSWNEMPDRYEVRIGSSEMTNRYESGGSDRRLGAECGIY